MLSPLHPLVIERAPPPSLSHNSEAHVIAIVLPFVSKAFVRPVEHRNEGIKDVRLGWGHAIDEALERELPERKRTAHH